MTRNGIQTILMKARSVYENSPEIFKPIEKFFEVDLEQRLYKKEYWADLTYESY
jgi:hypothetical protein